MKIVPLTVNGELQTSIFQLFQRKKEMKDETKTDRILWLYDALRKGQAVDRAAWADEHGVCERSVTRDLNTIQKYLDRKSEEAGEEKGSIGRSGIGKYVIRGATGGFLKEGELLGICKILLESRAFKKEEIQSLLDRLLDSVMSEDGKKQIQEYIANELYNYRDPVHKSYDAEQLWLAAQAVRAHHILTFSYRKIGGEKASPHRVRPVGILFSEFYFYLMGSSDGPDDKIHEPRTYRLDRMSELCDTGESFSVPYSERFKEGEFKNRVQFMYSGERTCITFRYFGPSVEAVLDRLPTAEIVEETAEYKTLRAEAMGDGILMWLLSQGSMIEILSPERLRDRWLGEARKILERAGKK